MQHTPLLSLLQEHLPLHRARLDLLARLLIALMRKGTVTLSKLALTLNPAAKPLSNQRRLQRFFAEVTLPMAGRIAAVLDWLGTPLDGASTRSYVLSLDRTQWTFGQLHLNLLVVALCTRSIAVPLAWTILPDTDGTFGAGGSKRGISTSEQRIALMERVLAVLPSSRIRALLGDREFVSRKWLQFLMDQQVPFVMRARGSIRASVRGRGVKRPKAPASEPGPGSAPLRMIFRGVAPRHVRKADRRRVVCGQRVFVGAIGHHTDPVYLVTTLPVEAAARLYADRWQIETMFRALKSQGFKLDTTHLHHPDRISRLIGVLSLAFVWAYRAGAWGEAARPPRMHLRPDRRPLSGADLRLVPHMSRFRRGFDALQTGLEAPKASIRPLLYCLREIILSCT